VGIAERLPSHIRKHSVGFPYACQTQKYCSRSIALRAYGRQSLPWEISFRIARYRGRDRDLFSRADIVIKPITMSDPAMTHRLGVPLQMTEQFRVSFRR
jgi:hypothetical protein